MFVCTGIAVGASSLCQIVLPVPRSRQTSLAPSWKTVRPPAVAREQGYSIETDLLQARGAGPTIIDEAVEREADLILIGVEYKKHFGQFSLGTVIPYVLKNAPCRVMLYHQYSGEAGEEK